MSEALGGLLGQTELPTHLLPVKYRSHVITPDLLVITQ
jgi:hypothetical protein